MKFSNILGTPGHSFDSDLKSMLHLDLQNSNSIAVPLAGSYSSIVNRELEHRKCERFLLIAVQFQNIQGGNLSQ